MIVVPQSFVSAQSVHNILIDGMNAVFLKETRSINPDEDRYVSTHALTLVLSGKLKVSTTQATQQVVSENQMIFLPKGLYMISDIIPAHKAFKAIVFFFEEGTTDEFLSSINKVPKTINSRTRMNVFSYTKEVKDFVESTIRLYGKPHHNHAITRFKLIELLNLIGRSEEGERLILEMQKAKEKPKGNVREFMEQNFDKGLNIEDYADLTGRSISTFHRDFKRQFGIAPKRWLITMRMEKAKELLNDPQMSVTQLALQLGYENISHFIKAFQKHHGISPKQFQIKRREEACL